MSSLIVLETRGTYQFKPWFQSRLRPLARRAAGAGVRANQVTLAAIGLSAATGVTLLVGNRTAWFFWLPPVLLTRMALNALDGILAREFGQATRLGVFLNELGDVISDVFLILPFAHVPGFSPFWIWIVAVSAVISEMAGVVAVMAGANRSYDGPMSKSDRAAVLAVLGLWIGLAGGIPPAAARWVPIAMEFLIILTIAQRVRAGSKETKEGAR